MSVVQPETSPARQGQSIAERIDGLRRTIDGVRIREHLRRVESDLRETDHESLSPVQRRNREQNLNRLAAYRNRDEYPTNRTETDRKPLFVGADGVPCAMAALLLADGREDLVSDVMGDEPTVRIETLPDDHPVIEWVEANGLTKAEAARIQPTYPESVEFVTTCGSTPCWAAFAVTSVIGMTAFATFEYAGYRLASETFPDNALKRRSVLGYVTTVNLFLAPLLALVLFALFP